MATLGEKRVVAGFNPSEEELVARFKGLGVELIDLVDALANTNSQTGRWKAEAMTNIETGVGYAVKAATAGQDPYLDVEFACDEDVGD